MNSNSQQKNKPTAKTHSPDKRRILTGVQATGYCHLGNYFGAIRPLIESSKAPENEVVFLCADWHALTNRASILNGGLYSHDVLALMIALGFKLEGNMMLLQSDFPQIQEIAWYLSCGTAVGLLERAHAFKDAVANGKEPTAGLFNYPTLMASDIVTFDAQFVPVGKDQKQHLEIASAMAHLFNNTVKTDVFCEPKGIVQDLPVLVGTDGERKMSKSYNNTIAVFAPKKEIEKSVKEIKTDSAGLDDPKNPDTCAVFLLLQSFGSDEAIAYMRERLSTGTGYGYGHAKKDFLDEHERVFGSKRELYDHLRNSPKELRTLMEPTYERATVIATAVKERARDALGLKSFRRQPIL